jgi:hypothetical protein
VTRGCVTSETTDPAECLASLYFNFRFGSQDLLPVGNDVFGYFLFAGQVVAAKNLQFLGL